MKRPSISDFVNRYDGRAIFDREKALAYLLATGGMSVSARPYVKNPWDKKGSRIIGDTTIIIRAECGNVFAQNIPATQDVNTGERYPEKDELYLLLSYVLEDGKWGLTKYACWKHNVQPRAPLVARLKEEGVWDGWWEALRPNKNQDGARANPRTVQQYWGVGRTTRPSIDDFIDTSGDNAQFDREKALAYLLVTGDVFVNARPYVEDNDGRNASQTVVGQTLIVFANCNDVFAWGCADSEHINTGGTDLRKDDLYRLLSYVLEDKTYGSTKYACWRRNMQPQAPLVRRLKDDGVWDYWWDALWPNGNMDGVD